MLRSLKLASHPFGPGIPQTKLEFAWLPWRLAQASNGRSNLSLWPRCKYGQWFRRALGLTRLRSHDWRTATLPQPESGGELTL